MSRSKAKNDACFQRILFLLVQEIKSHVKSLELSHIRDSNEYPVSTACFHQNNTNVYLQVGV